MSYADKVAKQVILVGLADAEIKKEVLGTSGINDKTLAETLGLIEDKEAAARSTAGSSAAGHITTYNLKIQNPISNKMTSVKTAKNRPVITSDTEGFTKNNFSSISHR